MKNMNILTILLAVAALLIGGYFLTRPVPEAAQPANQMQTYSSAELGIEFAYPGGPEGYVVQEASGAASTTDFKRAILLVRTADTLEAPPEGGEGPPIMAVFVFANPNKQQPRVWADSYTEFSNINLAIGEVREAIVGGANAIRYRGDGLYTSDVTVVAHGDSMYVIAGQFMDENSKIHRDYEPLLASIRFIPKLGQE